MANVFIGLGVMGYPMAGHLSRAGHQVFVLTGQLKNQENGLKSLMVGHVIVRERLLINQSIYLFVLEMMMMFCQYLVGIME